MVATSSPSMLSQACIAWPVSASGNPEAKPSTSTTKSRCQAAARWAQDAASAVATGIAVGQMRQHAMRFIGKAHARDYLRAPRYAGSSLWTVKRMDCREVLFVHARRDTWTSTCIPPKSAG